MYLSKQGKLAVATAGLAIALGGCGGGGATADSTTSLTKAQFVKQGNAICRKAFGEINRKYAQFSTSGENTATEAERNREAERIVPPALNKVVRELHALGAPNGEEQRVDKMLVTLEEGIKKGEEDPLALRGNKGEFALQEAYGLLWAYGLTGCGLGG